jgi:hypothetical protein
MSDTWFKVLFAIGAIILLYALFARPAAAADTVVPCAAMGERCDPVFQVRYGVPGNYKKRFVGMCATTYCTPSAFKTTRIQGATCDIRPYPYRLSPDAIVLRSPRTCP